MIVFHTQRVRNALAAPMRFGVELFALGLVGLVLGMIVLEAKQVTRPFQATVHIDLSYWALPKYTLLSLARGFCAYGLSLIFTLIYGTIAAHNHRAERVMIPALDILQSIPVLGFLPGLVIAMVNLFPNSEMGLEVACVVMIFTAQVWNMTFSFHGSLRNIPQPLREVARLQRFSGWQVFSRLELPSSMIGLVWNSMMSMAGGWFFLMVNEAFQLGDKDYRLPGIGSYMKEAVNQGNSRAMLAAVVAMVLMILAVDQLFWRPIVVWSQRFRMEDAAGSETPQAWLLDMLQHSRLAQWVHRHLSRHRRQDALPKVQPAEPIEVDSSSTILHYERAKPRDRTLPPWVGKALAGLQWAVVAALFAGALWGGWKLILLLRAVPLRDHENHRDWINVLMALGASFLRTSAAVILGAAWTLPVGIMIGRSPKWSQRLQPVIQVVASFPAPMIFPLVTLALLALHIPFGIGCVALMLLGAQWYILFNVIAGATAIPGDLEEVAKLYRVSRWQRWQKLYLPSVFPYLVTGLVTAAGGAWNSTIVAEYLEDKNGVQEAFGLGSMISEATKEANYPLLAAGVVTMAVSVVCLNRLIWKRMYRLSEERFSLNG